MRPIPELDGYRPTRDALHGFARILGGVRRHLERPHPSWWHISLRPTAAGLSTGPIVRDGVGALRLDLEVDDARLAIRGTGLADLRLPLDLGDDATAVGRRTLDAIAPFLDGIAVDEDHWRSDEKTTWDAGRATALHVTFLAVHDVLSRFRRSLDGICGPVQVWPHHFDMSFEWIGGRPVESDEGRAPAQIGFGLSTGDEGHPDPYLYANPWPFDDELTQRPLPAPGRWQTDAWQGSLMPLAAVRRAGPELAVDYLRAVFLAAEPGLR